MAKYSPSFHCIFIPQFLNKKAFTQIIVPYKEANLNKFIFDHKFIIVTVVYHLCACRLKNTKTKKAVNTVIVTGYFMSPLTFAANYKDVKGHDL